MPAQVRPIEKLAKLAYKILKVPKEQQQKNDGKPTQKRLTAWMVDSSVGTSRFQKPIQGGWGHSLTRPELKRITMPHKKKHKVSSPSRRTGLDMEEHAPRDKKVLSAKLNKKDLAISKKKEAKRGDYADHSETFTKALADRRNHYESAEPMSGMSHEKYEKMHGVDEKGGKHKKHDKKKHKKEHEKKHNPKKKHVKGK